MDSVLSKKVGSACSVNCLTGVTRRCLMLSQVIWDRDVSYELVLEVIWDEPTYVDLQLDFNSHGLLQHEQEGVVL